MERMTAQISISFRLGTSFTTNTTVLILLWIKSLNLAVSSLC